MGLALAASPPAAGGTFGPSLLAGIGDPLNAVGDRVERGEQPVGEVQADRECDADDEAEENLSDNHERVDDHEERDDGERRALLDRDAGVGAIKGEVRRIIDRVSTDGDAALREFAREFDGVHVEAIDVTDRATEAVERVDADVLGAIRDAAECMRDRALFDFLIYTGQRNTATRSLRIKDLDLENDRFRLNKDADGLKGAETNGKWRDLLLSSASLKQYLNTEHPAPDDPEAYVFTSRPKYGGPKPREMLDVTTLGGIVGRLADRAAEEYPAIDSKPTYPHALRHNFVTIALRRGMDETAIKHQIGHAPNSSVMESTYAHLKDSDHIRAARDAFDLETEDHESELTPEVCPRCGESPPEDARLCPYCGLAFTPDAEQAVEDAEEAVNNSYRQADDMETKEKVDLINDLVNDPDVKAILAEQRAEE